MRYRLVEAKDVEGLEQDVNAAIEDGWRPLGGVWWSTPRPTLTPGGSTRPWSATAAGTAARIGSPPPCDRPADRVPLWLAPGRPPPGGDAGDSA